MRPYNKGFVEIVSQWKYTYRMVWKFFLPETLIVFESQLGLLSHPRSYTIIGRQRTHLTYAFCEVMHRNIMKMLTVRGCGHNSHTHAPSVNRKIFCMQFITWCKLPCPLFGTWRLSVIQVLLLHYI